MLIPTIDDPKFTNAFLNRCFALDEKTGTLVWRNRPRDHFASDGEWKRWNGRYAGRAAGALDHGYVRIGLGGKNLLAHRIIWAIVHGLDLRDVPQEIDHDDLHRSNNGAMNLRPATRSQNQCNKGISTSNTSGHKGVSWEATGRRWRAYITINDQRVWLGSHSTIEAAVAARQAAQHLHGEFARMTANDNAEVMYNSTLGEAA